MIHEHALLLLYISYLSFKIVKVMFLRKERVYSEFYILDLMRKKQANLLFMDYFIGKFFLNVCDTNNGKIRVASAKI